MDNKNFPRLYNTLGRTGAIVGVLGLIILLSVFPKNAEMFYQAYLGGWIFWFSLTVGCFGLMLLQVLVRAKWGVPVIRLFEAASKLMVWMGLAFIPIVIAAYTGHLYPWADPARLAHDPVLQHRRIYLNPFGFMFRSIVYFVFFSTTTWFMTYLTRVQDRTGDISLAQNRTNVAAPCFVIMIFFITFGLTDWVMSLDPHWYSTIYGFWFAIGSALLGMAFCTLIVCLLRRAKIAPYSELVTPALTRDLGNLMLMMTMVWAYFSVSQYLITWSGNLPGEIVYYIKRNAGLMAWVSIAMVLLQFFIPFLMLLSSRTKRLPSIMISVTLIIISGRVLESAWNVIPMFHAMHAGLYAQFDVLAYYIPAWLGIGGLWLFGFVTILRRNPLIPVTAPATAEVTAHAS